MKDDYLERLEKGNTTLNEDVERIKRRVKEGFISQRLGDYARGLVFQNEYERLYNQIVCKGNVENITHVLDGELNNMLDMMSIVCRDCSKDMRGLLDYVEKRTFEIAMNRINSLNCLGV